MVLMFFTTSADVPIAETRKFVLEQAGHVVITAMNEDALLTACKEHAFKVAVIAHDVNSTMKKRALSIVRQYCASAKVLELYRPTRDLEAADSWLEAPVEPPELLAQRVTALMTMAAKGTN
jgi:CheY-like chemotaxis protein